MDLALNNLQRLICHKNQPSNQNSNLEYNYKYLWSQNLYSALIYEQ